MPRTEGLLPAEEATNLFLAKLDGLEEDKALDAIRGALDAAKWWLFEQQPGYEIVQAAIDAFDAKREEIRRSAETLDLLCRFQLIQDGAVHSEHVDTEAKALLAMWDEPHRKYHTREHLLACLRELDAVKHKAKDWKAIALALWCHDAVYRTERKGVPIAGLPLSDNERRSATLCGDVAMRLGWPHHRVYSAAMMVEASRHARDFMPSDYDEALMLDIDLAILSSTPAEYDRFEAQIREEYAHVPEAEFRKGRAAVLRDLGGETFSYRTGEFLDRNDAARANLTRAIERLEAT